MSANIGGDPFRPLDDLYEELARVRSLVEYYQLEYFLHEGDPDLLRLYDQLHERERALVKKILQLQRRL